jgi:hypothetical protein
MKNKSYIIFICISTYLWRLWTVPTETYYQRLKSNEIWRHCSSSVSLIKMVHLLCCTPQACLAASAKTIISQSVCVHAYMFCKKPFLHWQSTMTFHKLQAIGVQGNFAWWLDKAVQGCYKTHINRSNEISYIVSVMEGGWQCLKWETK